MRMAKGSGINGLGGMYPSTVWAEFPRVNILRPLLQMQKVELQELCRNEGVEWIEDPSNMSSDFVRNNIRRTLQENDELAPGIAGLVKICQDSRRHLKHLGMAVIGLLLLLYIIVMMLSFAQQPVMVWSTSTPE